TKEEPGDDGAECSAAETPLVQLGEIGGAPPRGDKPEDGDEGEKPGENPDGYDIHEVRETPAAELSVKPAKCGERMGCQAPRRYAPQVATALRMTQQHGQSRKMGMPDHSGSMRL